MEICGMPHPSKDITCTKEEPCWEYHTDDESGEVWHGLPVPKACAPTGTRAKLDLIAISDRMKP